MSAPDLTAVLRYIDLQIEDVILGDLGASPRVPPDQILALRAAVFRDWDVLGAMVDTAIEAAVARLDADDGKRAEIDALERESEHEGAKYLREDLRHGEWDDLREYIHEHAATVSERHAPQTVTVEVPADVKATPSRLSAAEIEQLVEDRVARRVADLTVQTLADAFRGTWTREARFDRGQTAICDGSLWLALRSVSTERPGKSDAWRLIAARGRDGRDHPARDKRGSSHEAAERIRGQTEAEQAARMRGEP